LSETPDARAYALRSLSALARQLVHFGRNYVECDLLPLDGQLTAILRRAWLLLLARSLGG
jgi:hypothetical protein